MEDSKNDDTNNQEQAVHDVFTSLCKYIGIEPIRSAESYITTSIAALEYACAVGAMCGLSREVFNESVENVWKRIQQGPTQAEDSDKSLAEG